MNISTKLLKAAAGAAGGAGLDIDEVFSTFLYDGNGDGSAATNVQTINNGIDLSGEGGMVWIKGRSHTTDHIINDTVRGAGNALQPNNTDANQTGYYDISQFNSNGFGLDAGGNVNANGYEYASWTFRQAPKFFDVMTYSGTGSAQNISHSLGSVPGMIIIKHLTYADNWYVYHRATDASAPEDYHLELNATAARTDDATVFNDTAPTSTQFTVGTNDGVNKSGSTYVAYLFAHNNSDGEFGPSGDQDVISCGSLTISSQATVEVNLGFEAQWVMLKRSSGTGNWFMFDVMRGMAVTGFEWFYANSNIAAEVKTYQSVFPTATGFGFNPSQNGQLTDGDYIYMAIRRGPLAEPTSATNVFKVDQGHGSNIPNFESGFPVDFGLLRQTSADGFKASARLTSGKYLETSSTAAESSNSNYSFDYQDGWVGSAFGTSYYSWMWKRAPGYFDVTTWSGTGSARTVPHGLTVPPEMMWIKPRNLSYQWSVYHKDVSNSSPYYELKLNSSNALANSGNTNAPFAGNPTATTIPLPSGTASASNRSGYNYIAYLFATVAGVSKVGSYSGTGSTQTIDCGFSNGARFVLIKCTNDAENWIVFDSERGIVSGNDPYLALNTTDAQITSSDFIDPVSSGFAVNTNSGEVNNSSNTYIFYAIA